MIFKEVIVLNKLLRDGEIAGLMMFILYQETKVFKNLVGDSDGN